MTLVKISPLAAIALAVLIACPTEPSASDVISFESLKMVALEKHHQDGCEDFTVVDLPDINFDFDASTLRPSAAAQMDDFADVLLSADFRTSRFSLEGHTDARGTDEYNVELSKKRVLAVRNALTERGVQTDRVSVRYFGEQRLLLPNEPENERNRRVSLVVSDENSAVALSQIRADSGSLELVGQLKRRLSSGYQNLNAEVPLVKKGDQLFLCIAAPVRGRIVIEVSGNNGLEKVGDWLLPEQTLLRVPEQHTFNVDGKALEEKIRLKFIPCDHDCTPEVTQSFEAIRLSRPKPVAVQDSLPLDPPCGTMGVQCKLIKMKVR